MPTDKPAPSTIRTIICLIALLLMSACTADPIQRETTNNKDITIDLLFDHDGCRGYRFYDTGEWRYYVVCGTRTTTSYQIQHGKSSRPESIDTIAEATR